MSRRKIRKGPRGHPKGTCQMRVEWVFRRFSTSMSSYLENGAFYTQSYYRTVIGNHMQAIEWCQFRWPWVTPDPGFKDTVVLRGECLQSDAFSRPIYSYYRTLIGNHRHAIDRQAIAIQLTTPLLLCKPCKPLASVARVCQRQLAFLVETAL